MKKGLLKKALSVLVSAAMLTGLISPLGDVNGEVQAAENDTFTLYYEYSGSDTLYANIWNHSGLEFGDDAVTDYTFGWANVQSEFSVVSTDTSWKYTTFKIKADSADGFSIYKGDSSSTLNEYDNQWNNTEIYAKLVSGESDVYCIDADGNLYTSTEDAGIEFTSTPYSQFTLYYEYSGSNTLYANIWNHSGLEFGDDAVTDYTFGWTNVQSEFSVVSTDTSWKYTTFKIKADSADGFSIYKGDSSSTLNEYDNQWNNTEIYAKLVSGESDVYCIDAEGNIYTSTEDAQINFDVIPEKAEISVDRVANLSEDFMLGTDISAVHSIYNSGAKYYDFAGNALTEAGFFQLLADQGVNWVRIRVWNDPYDADGNGYGGGNNDLATAVEMGKLASDAGLKVLIDFHYSDFWADPGKQKAPKAWSDYSITDKENAVYDFTYNSLKTLLDARVDVGMVQVGNETNGKVCGESTTENICKIFNAGSSAIRKISDENTTNIKVAVHFTNPETSGLLAGYAKNLDDYSVDYDVFASSYYPYWHGSLSNLNRVLKNVADTYNKEVMVAETSYAWTLDDGDGWENTVRKGTNDTGDDLLYPFTINGQAKWVRDVVDTVNSINNGASNCGVGVFYWEAAWIPVGNINNGATLEENKALWEENGSGWASSFAAGYDPDDAGKWYGGSAIDNQAFFDFDGKALPSLKVYSYLNTGAVAKEVTVDKIEDSSVTVIYNADLSGSVEAALPTKVQAILTDATKEELEVTWNEDDVTAVTDIGEYVINGKAVRDGISYDTVCNLTVKPENLLTDFNFSFENGTEPWTIESGKGAAVETDNPHDGASSVHFYSTTAESFTVEQTITLDPGTYNFSGWFQGDAKGETGSKIYLKAGDDEYTKDIEFTGWGGNGNWKNPEIENVELTDKTDVTIGFIINYGAEGWGTADDFYLYAVNDGGIHTLEKVEAVSATCGKDGSIEYYTCPVCGKLYSDEAGENEITEADIVAKATGNHSWNEGVVTKEPTTSAEGVKTYTCTVCNETKTEPIDKLPAENTNPKDNDTDSQDNKDDSNTDNKGTDSKSDDKNTDSKTDEKNTDSKSDDKNTDSKTDDKNTDSKTDNKNTDSKTDDKGTDSKSDDKNTDSKTDDKNTDSKTDTNTGKESGGSSDKTSGSDTNNTNGSSEDKNNTIKAGWFQNDAGVWYYRHEDGTLAQNEWIEGYWIGADGSWTYQPKGYWMQNETGIWWEDTSGYYPVNEWVKVDDYWHYFNEKGYKEVTSYRDGYWLDMNGAWDHVNYPYTGSWEMDTYGWYFIDGSGWYPANEWMKINGRWFYFYASGYMAHDISIDGCYLGSDGAWAK